MTSSVNLAWEKCLGFIRDNISIKEYDIWFSPIKPIKLVDKSLNIEVPSKFFYEWLEEHYLDLLRMAIQKELGEGINLVYSIRMENPTGNKSAFTEKIPSLNRSISKNLEKGDKYNFPFFGEQNSNILVDPQLNVNYNFESFLEGDSNRLPRSAALTIANKPGKTSFNPLFIFGNVGLGKTHLAHAIGNEVRDKHIEKIILYVSAEKFRQQYVNSIVKNKRNDFMHFYQNIDVLIVDDIQLLSGKPKTQDVFFHIFNHLHQNGKQVVLTSDKAPVDMQDIEHRLLSRFKWGLSAELLPPDYDISVKILRNKVYRDGVEMPEDIIDYIAKNIRSSIRELEGTIISLIAHSSFNKKEITIDLAKSVIEKFVKNTKKEITVEQIQKVVSSYFQMDVETLQAKTRKRDIVQARQLAMFFSKKYTKSSLAMIGSKIGKRDHATVLHACKTVSNLIDTDKQFKKYTEDILKKII